MEVKNIEDYFSVQILRRGYDYYKNGKVKSINKSDNKYSATVKGTEEYEVKMLIENGIINEESLTCTCPYAEEDNCKHMAAVLYCLKKDKIPVKENNIKITAEEITNFSKFKIAYQKEFYKLFHNRKWLESDELEDFVELINKFIIGGIKFIDKDIYSSYEIFEFLIKEAGTVDVYDIDNTRDELVKKIFKSFNKLFNDKTLFNNLLSLFEKVFKSDSEGYYYHFEDILIDLIYHNIENEWQAKDALDLLNKIDNDRKIYDFDKDKIRPIIVYLNYYYVDEKSAIYIANKYLDNENICDFLVTKSKNQNEKINILEKIINSRKSYASEKYYEELLSIYKELDEYKYIDLLKKYYKEYSSIKIYHMIKYYYSAKEWIKLKKQYLKMTKDRNLYCEICIEEEYYDELIEMLKDCWTETINNYIYVLKDKKPKELLELYSETILNDIIHASDRKQYKKVLVNFNNFKRIPDGIDKLKDIIKHLRENYKNRKALQEELDFYEDTYL